MPTCAQWATTAPWEQRTQSSARREVTATPRDCSRRQSARFALLAPTAISWASRRSPGPARLGKSLGSRDLMG